jgi:hypothetical protein
MTISPTSSVLLLEVRATVFFTALTLAGQERVLAVHEDRIIAFVEIPEAKGAVGAGLGVVGDIIAGAVNDADIFIDSRTCALEDTERPVVEMNGHVTLDGGVSSGPFLGAEEESRKAAIRLPAKKILLVNITVTGFFRLAAKLTKYDQRERGKKEQLKGEFRTTGAG